MKFITSVFIVFVALQISAAPVDFKKDCLIAQKYQNDPNPQNRVDMLDWVKNQITQLGFAPNFGNQKSFVVELGVRPYYIGLHGDMENCEVVGFMLQTLQKLKTEKPAPEGMVLFFGRGEETYKSQAKLRVELKSFEASLDDVQNHHWRLYHDFVKADENPRKVLDVATLTKSLNKLRGDLKKVIDEEEVKSYKDSLKTIESKSKDWAVEKLYKIREDLKPLEDANVTESLNQKFDDLQTHIALHDEIRRGLWEKANKTLEKIKSPSENLKVAMAKGRGNIEGILKVIRSDANNLEKDIRQSFKEQKDLLEKELKDAS